MTQQYAIVEFYDEEIRLATDALGKALVFDNIAEADEIANHLDNKAGEPYTRVISLNGVQD